MEIIAKYTGYDDNWGMKFSRDKGIDVEIRDGERPLEIGKKYKIIAHEFELGDYGDDLIVTDYEIEEYKNG